MAHTLESSMIEIIETYDLSHESSVTAYETLASGIAGLGSCSREFVEDTLRQGEVDYMELKFSDNPAAKKKSGEWKFRTYLPTAYVSAKSTLIRTVEFGINILDANGKVRGKSELEREIKASKEFKTPAEDNPNLRALSYLQKILNVWGELDSDTKDLIETEIVKNKSFKA